MFYKKRVLPVCEVCGPKSSINTLTNMKQTSLLYVARYLTSRFEKGGIIWPLKISKLQQETTKQCMLG